jgi:hypothetical protein
MASTVTGALPSVASASATHQNRSDRSARFFVDGVADVHPSVRRAHGPIIWKDDKVTMSVICSRGEARGLRHAVHRMVSLALILGALASFKSGETDAGILFASGTDVPRTVQEFAWRVIETRCNFYGSELGQRSFWAYDARAMRVDAAVVYSIKILSDVTWRKREPPVLIEMTVLDDGEMRLTALKSSFITCSP